MPDPKLRIPKPHLHLEMIDINGSLNKIIELALEAKDRGTLGAKSAINHVRNLLRANCSHYKACDCQGSLCVLCISGADGQNPFRGKECRQCIVSQLTRTGMYTGESYKLVAIQPQQASRL